jgi:heat shock protein HslJ
MKKIVPIIILLSMSIFTSGCDLTSAAPENAPTPEIPIEDAPAQPQEEIPDDSTDKTSEPEVKVIFIGPHQIECEGAGPQLCYQIKENPEDEWGIFYDQIEGFEWDEGFIYQLRVAIYKVENPPADASSLRYELLEVISKEPYVTEYPSTYVKITSPIAGATVDPNQPILVTGMGASLFEGNVVVKIEDTAGNELALASTILDSPEAGTGGEGPWSIELSIEVDSVSDAVITAFSTSPKDGSVVASDSVYVVFGQPQETTSGLEGRLWLLTEFNMDNATLNPLLATYTISMEFFPDDQRIAGKAACNNYFASYQVDGDTLTLGPAGSTMMICPDTEMTLDAAFLAALEHVTGFQLDADTLTLTDAGGDMVLRFRVDPYSASKKFTRTELASTTYLSNYVKEGNIKLDGGVFHASTAEGAASGITVMLSNYAAFGDLNGDGVEDAVVILATNPGYGASFDLAVVEKQGDDLVNTNIASLGDQLVLLSLGIKNRQIEVMMIVVGPGDTACCPNTMVTRHYVYENGALVLVEK